MQVQKADIKLSILKAARKEFKKKGFVSANIRKIAEDASISVGNLYNYFRGKDELFIELVRPTTDSIRKALSDMYSEDMVHDQRHWSLDYHYKMVETIADFIDDHRENLNLLFFKSYKSSMQSFREEVIEMYTSVGIKMIDQLKPLDAFRSGDVSDFFLHTLASLYVNIIEELLMHKLRRDDIRERLNEMMYFLFYGWDGLIDIGKIFEGQSRME